MPDIHAKLAPSAAFRWITCPPSALQEAAMPDKSSDAAKEGTAAHALAELMIKYNAGVVTKREFNSEYKKLKTSEWYNQEMEETISDYAHSVWEIYNEAKAKTKDALLFSEHRTDLSEYIPGGFGTIDVTIVADDTLQIIDLKYGKGVKVDAPENPQLRIYALGALSEYDMLYDIKMVKTTIIQPRIDHISTEEISAEDLKSWGEKTLKPAAKIAAKGEGEYHPGEEQCRFCRIADTCRARAGEHLKTAKDDFPDLPPELSDEEVADLLPRLDDLIRWAKGVQDYALNAAVNEGVKFDSYKLVEGRSVRRYKDEVAIARCLIGDGYEEEQIYEKKLLGISKMEKLVGKKHFDELTKGLIEKPQGKPALVPENDKRPALDSIEEAKNDFKEE